MDSTVNPKGENNGRIKSCGHAPWLTTLWG